jgi:SAM-dependent methyltransferase
LAALMRAEFVNSLRCTECSGSLTQKSTNRDGNGERGMLECAHCSRAFPVVRGIPRFVSVDNYASNFGFQWNQFRRTQLDSATGVRISRERFLKSAGIDPGDLEGKLVLDVGCGAGRFTEVALSLGARVVALDYSTAVEACDANLGGNPRLDVVQGDIYHLPFPLEHFDFIYCFGVLQHTPNAAAAFAQLPRFLKPGGRLAVDFYPKLARNLLWSKYWIRPVTRRIPQPVLFRWIQRLVPKLLPVSDLLASVPGTRGRLRYLIPIANYRGVLPLNDEQQREWAVLDTFDMLAPEHDHPVSVKTLRGWFDAAGLVGLHIERPGFIIAYAMKPGSA